MSFIQKLFDMVDKWDDFFMLGGYMIYAILFTILGILALIFALKIIGG